MRWGRSWELDELQTLRDLAQTKTGHEVAGMLNRTPMSVYRKASELGIRFTKRGARAGYAKYDDSIVIAILRRFYRGETTTQISADTGIPVGTLTNWTSGQQRGHLMLKVNGAD